MLTTEFVKSEGSLESSNVVNFIADNTITSWSRVRLSKDNGYKMIIFVSALGTNGIIFGKKSSDLVKVGDKLSRSWNIVKADDGKLKIAVPTSTNDGFDAGFQD